MINSKGRRLFLGILFILLLAFGLFSAIYSLMNPRFNVIVYLSGFATYMIALLTVVYVLTTSRQLDVMAEQLNEMQRDRELRSQPLPWVKQMKVFIEKPRFFFTPPSAPDDQYSTHCRYRAKFSLKNIGSSPAVCVDVSVRIALIRGDKTEYLDSVSVRVDTLEEKQIYPYDKGTRDDFVFASDDKGLVLMALRETDMDKYPHLLLRVLYKNILGGCFVLHNEYMLYPASTKQDAILKNWLSQTSSFYIQYKKELNVLRELQHSNKERWSKLFNRIKARFIKKLIGKTIELHVWPIPGAFSIHAISTEEYTAAISNISYGKMIPVTSIGCPAIDRLQKDRAGAGNGA